MGTVYKYNQLMKDLPLDDLLSSTDLNVQELPTLIFSTQTVNSNCRLTQLSSLSRF